MWQDTPTLTLAPCALPSPSPAWCRHYGLHEGSKKGKELGSLITCSRSALGVDDDPHSLFPGLIVLHGSTSVTHHDTLLPLSSLLSFLGLLGDTTVPFPGLTFTV